MDISLHWLNQYLEPGDVSADEADDVLTHAGLPIEAVRPAGPGAAPGDLVLDVEVTSNRPDCLSHLGCAREIAASPRAGKPRRLVFPAFRHEPAGADAASLLALENRDHAACPRFTARVIRGAAIGPSPAWLAQRLEAVGQRAINNAVDVTNFITLEFGNPCHVFDLAALAGAALVVRYAHEGETLRTLDGRDRTLAPSDLVVADAERAQSLAGVIGGADSEVTPATTDIVFEMATWDPVTVRAQARRLNITTDAAQRFQKGVDPRTLDLAGRRAAALIAELTGGVLCQGVLDRGAPLQEPARVTLRLGRAAKILGVDILAPEAIDLLTGLDIAVERDGDDALRCLIPPHRARDLTREIDLIEELARVKGYDAVPRRDAIPVVVKPPQPRRRAITELGRVLTGLGFDETVTFSFTSPARAALFLQNGLDHAAVDDDRRKEEPALRPSALAGLLACRRANQDARAAPPGLVRLYEIASVFAQRQDADRLHTLERPTLALLADAPGPTDSIKRTRDDLQLALRLARGAVDAAVRAMHGPEASLDAQPHDPADLPDAWDPDATARLRLITPHAPHPVDLGRFGLIADAARRAFELDLPVVAAELDLDPLIAGFPPNALAHALPAFPAIERDLSLVVDEAVAWDRIAKMVEELRLARLEACAFVGVFRGKQTGPGKKSVTLRLRFRDPDRTLRREEVDPEVEAVLREAAAKLKAETRT